MMLKKRNGFRKNEIITFLALMFTVLMSTCVFGEPKAPPKVVELENQSYYSMGKKSAKQVSEWVEKNIHPELFDLWHGKKERFFLNGSWKIVKLAGTADSPDCRYGLDHGFETNSFDDSKWFNQPVPFPANYWLDGKKRAKNGETRPIFVGVSWLRRKFHMPKRQNDKRYILCFRAVGGKECEIFVNGQKVATHRNIRVLRVGITYSWEEGFEVDLTDALKYDGENALAVRIYESARSPMYKNKRVPDKRLINYMLGGIWQEVYLDIRPNVYLKKALISPSLKNSSISVKAFIVNSSDSELEFKPSLELLAWNSDRYKLWNGEKQTAELKKYSLRPGVNELAFEVTLKNPRIWSPEHPYLYHLKLLDGKGLVIGQERFGFRDFKCGKSYFHLNGKRITMRGEQCLWSGYCGRPGRVKIIYEMGMLNNKRVIEKWYDKYLAMNMNLVRTHSSWYPHCFYDIADEKGALLYDELSFYPRKPFCEGLELTALTKERIKDRAYAAHNHPCVVMLSFGNEKYDQDLYFNDSEGTAWAPYLDALYKEYKKYDPNRAITSSSGRLPTESSLEKTKAGIWAITEKYAKSDFYDCHNYQMCWNELIMGEVEDWEFHLKKYYDAYALDYGRRRPMINGETNISGIPIKGYEIPKTYKELCNEFLNNRKNGKLDRNWLTKEWSVLKTKYGHGKTIYATERAFGQCGFQNVAIPEKARLEQAKFSKRIIEQHRHQREYCAGIVSNAPRTFINNTIDPLEPVYSYTKKACQPILACVDEKFNRNLMAGIENDESKLYVMNDTENTIDEVTLTVSLKDVENKKQSVLHHFKLSSLEPAEMKTLKINPKPSSTLPSGHYQFILEVHVKGELKSVNDYPMFLCNSKTLELSAKNKRPKTAVYFAPKNLPVRTGFFEQTKKIMSELKIEFETIDSLDKVIDFELLVLPPHCVEKDMTSEKFAKWLDKGGKVLAFEQLELPPGMPGRLRSTGRFGFFTELIEFDHPIFKGLEQNDFRYWNGDRDKVRNKWLLDHCFLPLNPGLLACMPTVSERVGMSIEEVKIGEGLILASQLKAMGRYKKDSVATQFIVNLFDYAMGEWRGEQAYVCKDSDFKKKTGGKVFEIDSKKAFFVDLRPYVNMGFKDEKAHDGKGGWTDQGPNFDLRSFPVGKQLFKGVPFKIIDPSKNNGKSCLVLRGLKRSKTDFLPDRMLKIKVGKKVNKLFFLVSSAWVFSTKEIGKIRVVFDARGVGLFGTREIKLVNHKNIADWWHPGLYPLSNAAIAWSGLTKNRDKMVEVGAYMFEWKNPDPSRAIEYIEFFSNKEAVPILLAVTGEETE